MTAFNLTFITMVNNHWINFSERVVVDLLIKTDNYNT